MKLAACYNVFDGEELLEASLRSIRSQCDYVVACFQLTSHFGNPARPTLRAHLDRLGAGLGLIDELVLFEPEPLTGDRGRHYHAQAARKRNLAREFARGAGCTHYLSMDCDEFYRAAELEAAKQTVEELGADVTATCVRDYRYRPTWRSIHPGRYFVPFICRATLPIHFTEEPYYFCHADPSRRVYGSSPYVFAPNVVEMHHMTSVRAEGGLGMKAANAPMPEGWSPSPEPASGAACDCVEVDADEFAVEESIARWRAC